MDALKDPLLIHLQNSDVPSGDVKQGKADSSGQKPRHSLLKSLTVLISSFSIQFQPQSTMLSLKRGLHDIFDDLLDDSLAVLNVEQLNFSIK